MGKATRTSRRNSATQSGNPDEPEALPGRIKGATITSWRGPPRVDLEALFAKPATGATVGGSGGTGPGGPPAERDEASGAKAKTVSLSDGTQITFATAAPVAVS